MTDPVTRRRLVQLLLMSAGLSACDHDITIVNPAAPDPP